MAASYPKTMSELVEQYDSKLRTLVRGIGLGDVEDDVVQEIYLYFLEKRLLEAFDPTRVAFSTYFYGYARNLALRFYKKRKKRRDKQTHDEVLDWMLVENPSFVFGLSEEAITTILIKLFGLKIQGKRDLFRLFSDALVMAAETGKINQAELARMYNLSPSSITNQLRDLANLLLSWGFVVKTEGGSYEWSETEIRRARCRTK